MSDHLKGREILITGGTGSLGKELIKQLIRDHEPRGIRVFSRDELKQWNVAADVVRWRAEFDKTTPVAFLIGDVRNLDRLRRAMEGVDVVIHAAALKQIGSCETNPLEAVLTNIHGAENVLNAALDCVVEKVMYTNTDKAVKCVNLYGATKAVAEKIFIHGNTYSGARRTTFSACRYGNVLDSRGSVAHIFREQAAKNLPLSITHRAMTRFWITIPSIAAFILARLKDMNGGEIYVPKMKSMGIYQMACAMAGWDINTFKSRPDAFVITGIRQGEKLHESLFCEEEYTQEQPDYYVVSPRRDVGIKQDNWELVSNRNPNGELTQKELLDMLSEIK